MDVYVISEIGINHNGDLELAKKMILESQKCGASLYFLAANLLEPLLL